MKKHFCISFSYKAKLLPKNGSMGCEILNRTAFKFF
jgi:hypothetical protein